MLPGSSDATIAKMLEVKSTDKRVYLFVGALIIDEFIIGYIPVVPGKGIAWFYKGSPEVWVHVNELFVNDGTIIGCYTRQ